MLIEAVGKERPKNSRTGLEPSLLSCRCGAPQPELVIVWVNDWPSCQWKFHDIGVRMNGRPDDTESAPYEHEVNYTCFSLKDLLGFPLTFLFWRIIIKFLFFFFSCHKKTTNSKHVLVQKKQSEATQLSSSTSDVEFCSRAKRLWSRSRSFQTILPYSLCLRTH